MFEHRNTLRDLLGITGAVDAELEIEPYVHGYRTNADALVVSKSLAEQLLRAAGRFADLAPMQWARHSGCTEAQAADDGCASRFIAAFGLRAFRRPLAPDEIASYLALYKVARGEGGAAAGAHWVVKTMLQSPHHLYRPELGATLVDFELASALSYTVVGSMPDAPLLEAAQAGRLRDPAELERQAKRLLADPKAKAVIRQFVLQWLAVPETGLLAKDDEVFPHYTPALQKDLLEEIQRRAEESFLGAGAKVAGLFASEESFVNKRLASYYGVTAGAPTADDRFEKVRLDPSQRAGLLTSGAVLAAWSNATTTDPATRGKLLLERVLCQEIPPPPPTLEVPPLREDKVTTTRDRFVEHSKNPTCAACHETLDAVAFALEGYDPTGKFRTRENNRPIDASGTLRGTGEADGPFEDGVELLRRLAGTRAARACAARQYVRFAAGDAALADDRCLVDGLVDALAKGGDAPVELLLGHVKSPAFATRR